MILDNAIHVFAVLGVVVSLWQRQALFAASLLLFSFLYNSLIFVEFPSWYQFAVWCILFAAKDLLILTLFGFRKNTTELIMLLSFAVSCLFHQALLAQVLTNDQSNLTLLPIRPKLMMYLSIVQLATVFFIIIGSGTNGGKRAKYRLFSFDHRFHTFFYHQTYKVKP